MIFRKSTGFAEIENVSNKEFGNVCEWFADNKLSIHFGEDKTKCLRFSEEKNLPWLLNIHIITIEENNLI